MIQATWDDYPNGRWGDARSPAYGEIDGYGVSLHMSISSAIKLWGTFLSCLLVLNPILHQHMSDCIQAILKA